ncbi:TonB-dependent receptor [Massilia sp. PAMC28688]|uniref:TonB-dependent receptor plug domain-containing protein n=1 Tax=Massilia sp. PAMC28688 TaxID=2861283 RepID=UPI001C628AE4|nr:TonB-dependent receptor [Massilia sp. PAMC28688]QYF95485.1 TonB-dependent receptor [Massilia sp. PAMC28688]
MSNPAYCMYRCGAGGDLAIRRYAWREVIAVLATGCHAPAASTRPVRLAALPAADHYFPFMSHQLLLLGLFAACCYPAAAQQLATPTQVVVTGSQTDTEAGRDFVAGKKIISRKRIQESGLDTVEALLKRDPAVTIGADGRVGLQGMPGYTQFLVDGAAPRGGQSLQLALVNVEKIEIIKSSIAEYGPYGIAGTINVITRKAGRKTQTDLTLGAGSADGRPAANIALSHNESAHGSPWRWRAQLGASERHVFGKTDLTQTAVLDGAPEQLEYRGSTRGRNRQRNIDASVDVNWQVSQAHSLNVAPAIGRFSVRGRSDEERRWAAGGLLEVSAHDRSSLTMLTLPIKWLFRPSKKSQLEINLNSTHMRASSVISRLDAIDGGPDVARWRTQENDFDSGLLSIVYKASLAGGHSIKLGASYKRGNERNDFDYLINGRPDVAFGALGAVRTGRTEQARLYAQDDWRFSDATALNLGVSGEDSGLRIAEGGYSSDPRYRLWSPSAHLSHKIGGDDNRQVRLSVARTYRAPGTADLSLRPVINPLAPCSVAGVCSANTVDTADTAGNPWLLPERSLGINLSYERGLGPDSQLTLEVFARRIDRKTGIQIGVEDVPWSSLPRYVVRPVNLGDAQAEGISLEMDLALRDFFDGMYPATTLRTGLGVARSRISNLPGPDDRLDSQSPWNAKLGISHVMSGMPVKLNVDASWTPGVWVRSNPTQRVFQSRRFDLDAGAIWTINGDQRLTLNLSNLAPRTARQIDEYVLGRQLIRTDTGSRKFSSLSISLETKL